MRIILSLLLLVASAMTVTADFGVYIVEIESMVQYMLTKFAHHVTYHGPTGTASAAAKTWHPTPTPGPPTPTATSPSYWLEEIKHQGVAAFNPNTSYQVFRNVQVPSPSSVPLAAELDTNQLVSRTLEPKGTASPTTLRRSTLLSVAAIDVAPGPAIPRPLHPL